MVWSGLIQVLPQTSLVGRAVPFFAAVDRGRWRRADYAWDQPLLGLRD